MTSRPAGFTLAIVVVAWLAVATVMVGQDTLARAKDLYVMAAYDEALVLLDRMHGSATTDQAAEIAGYQVLCLVALGRTDEARTAIEALVKASPLYRLSETVASPRTREFFDEVRRGLLPQIVQESYDRAKSAFDRGEPKLAVSEFDRVLALLDEPGVAERSGMSDLRRLAVGFRDLSLAAVAAAAAAAAAAGPPTASSSVEEPDPAPAEPSPPATYSAADTEVAPPVTVSRPMPPWRPRNSLDARQEYHGVITVLVDEKGEVASAELDQSVHPAYDAALLKIALTWKFRPATKGGVPVRYRSAIKVHLRPSGT